MHLCFGIVLQSVISHYKKNSDEAISINFQYTMLILDYCIMLSLLILCTNFILWVLMGFQRIPFSFPAKQNLYLLKGLFMGSSFSVSSCVVV